MEDKYKTKEQLIAELNSLKDRLKRFEKSEALNKSTEERLAVTLRSIREGVISTDNTGSIILINEVAQQLLGQTQAKVIGKPINEVFYIIDEANRIPCENSVKHLVNIKKNVGLPNHAILIAKDGTEKIIAYNAYPMRNQSGDVVGMVLAFWNITKQRRLEEELLKAQKLESIALLAGGIAHDFNNILTVVNGNLALGKMYCQPNDKIYERLIEAERACLLAKELTQQLLTFAKGETPVKKVISLGEIVLQSTSFALRGTKLKSVFSIPDDLWPVEADRGQMSQVIHNLMINAVQAMPEGGTIQVQAKNLTIKPSDHIPLITGKCVKISVSDSGKGIAKKDLLRIFDPYFTTKQQGHGLGLTIIYTIIARHNGYVYADSQLGKGTTFHIYLPAATEKSIEAQPETPERRIGKGKILLMDDQEAVLETVAQMLEYIGYEVTCAKDGKKAIELYRYAKASNNPFDAVIMDLTIPGGMGGKECIQKLKEIEPKVKALVSSGYSNDPVLVDYERYGFSGTIAKPHTIESLREALFKVLSGN